MFVCPCVCVSVCPCFLCVRVSVVQDADGLLAGLNNEDMMISNLSQVLDEERDARRSAEEENTRLQAEADGKHFFLVYK